MTECPTCGSTKVERNGSCASCNFEQRKSERTKVKVIKPVKKVTEKRSKQNQEYARLRDQYLEAYPACEVVECSRKSTEIHHMQTRTNENLTNVDMFLAVCRLCHERITVDSAWAIENGYSYPRAI